MPVSGLGGAKRCNQNASNWCTLDPGIRDPGVPWSRVGPWTQVRPGAPGTAGNPAIPGIPDVPCEWLRGCIHPGAAPGPPSGLPSLGVPLSIHVAPNFSMCQTTSRISYFGRALQCAPLPFPEGTIGESLQAQFFLKTEEFSSMTFHFDFGPQPSHFRLLNRAAGPRTKPPGPALGP